MGSKGFAHLGLEAKGKHPAHAQKHFYYYPYFPAFIHVIDNKLQI